jgi:hypothetical protein
MRFFGLDLGTHITYVAKRLSGLHPEQEYNELQK